MKKWMIGLVFGVMAVSASGLTPAMNDFMAFDTRSQIKSVGTNGKAFPIIASQSKIGLLVINRPFLSGVVVYLDKANQSFWVTNANWRFSSDRIVSRRATNGSYTNVVGCKEIISVEILTALDKSVLIGTRIWSGKYAGIQNVRISETDTMYLTGASVGNDAGHLSYSCPVIMRYNQKLSDAMNSVTNSGESLLALEAYIAKLLKLPADQIHLNH